MVEELGRAKRLVRKILVLISVIFVLSIYDCMSFLVDPNPPLRALWCRSSVNALPFSLGGIIVLTILIEREKRRLFEFYYNRSDNY